MADGDGRFLLNLVEEIARLPGETSLAALGITATMAEVDTARRATFAGAFPDPPAGDLLREPAGMTRDAVPL